MFFILLKTQLNNRLGLSAIKSNRQHDKKAFRKQMGTFAAVVFSMLYLLAFYCFLVYKFFGLTQQAGMPDLILILAVSATMIVTLILGLIFMLGSLFFAKDSEFLATLPIKPSVVFAAKFAQVYLNELISTAFFLIPPFLVYGIGLQMGILFYLKAVLIILLVPAIPLLISALLAMLLMNFVSKTRSRDTFMVIGGILLIALIFIGENMLIANMPENGDTQYLIAILSSQTGLINFLGRAFPPSAWATLALVKNDMSGLVALVNFICLSVVLLVVTIPLATKIYYRGALSQLETAKKNKKSSKKISIGRSTPFMAVFFREWKTITRSPIYAMNSLVSIFMGFIIMLMPLFGGSKTNDLNTLLQMISGEYTAIVLLSLTGIILFVGGINPAASTVISREGNSFWISKNIPVDYKTQIVAKFMFGFSIAAAAAITTTLGAVIGLKVAVPVALGALVLGLLVLVSITAVAVIIDIARPKFNWNNETEAIKQNMNSLAAMLASMIIIVAYGAIAWLMITLKLPDIAIIAVEALIALVTGVLAYRYMVNHGEKRFAEIEQ